LKLVRTRIGPLTLEGLQVGKWRQLTSGEVAGLRRAGARHQADVEGALRHHLAR
jgi:16S rRNA U516 pseudouridylate synthase RsuA-like enzyme